MSRKQSAKDILKTISQDLSNQSKSSTSTSNRLPTSTHRTRKRVRCYCPKCKGKFVDPRTKEQHSLTTSQQLPQTELNELRQPTLTSELNVLSQQTVTTVDSWSDIEREDNEPSSPGLNNEPLSSLDMDNLSFLPKKRQQTSSAKINILDTKEQGAALVDESRDNKIMLDYNDEEDDDDNDLLSEEELAEDIWYSNINEFEDFSAPNIDYENEFQSRLRVLKY
ncbi:hypothetical protein F8M41_019890 [Gigaspora margarita]|uniref:Uncharacterized protein n=1 Tax=Gigaspora margarita TaxID=4874 RepID=A0A8H4AJB0_GIGMA|nr:hypothetical protein F8M41_019890 [Gigaspora margarita]